MPRLSVLMPVRNGSPYVRTAVGSTLRSLPPDSELVVLNDGSSDDTAQVLHEVGDPRLVVHEQPKGSGVAAALNTLLDRTDSEFVARMDADDICGRGRFARQLGLLEQHDVVFSSVLIVDAAGRIRRSDLPGPIGGPSIGLHLLLASCLWHPTMAARRSALPPTPYRSLDAEDYDLWLRLAADGARMYRDFRPLVRYRVHSSQVTARTGWQDVWRKDEDRRLADSWNGLAERLTIPVRASQDLLLFPLAGVAVQESRAEVRALLDQIRGRLSGLRVVDRLVLRVRLASAERRLRRS